MASRAGEGLQLLQFLEEGRGGREKTGRGYFFKGLAVCLDLLVVLSTFGLKVLWDPATRVCQDATPGENHGSRRRGLKGDGNTTAMQ